MQRPPKLLFALSLLFLLIGAVLFLLGVTNLPPTLFSTNNPQPQVQQPSSDSRSETSNQVLPANAQQVKVTRVIDGDTIEIEGGQKIRYIGINTPETVDPRRGVQCFGHEASNKNKELVEGKTIRIEKDVSETDKYGRLLRFVWVGDLFVNDYLVRSGYAYADTFPPDVKYEELFLNAQQEAQSKSLGLWASCTPSPKKG